MAHPPGNRLGCTHATKAPHLYVCRNGICICRECLWRMARNEPNA